jgi:hypothetical protein
MAACRLHELAKLKAELLAAGVPSVTDEGILLSRRMVRDEHKRRLCQQAGKRGGNPTLKGSLNPTLKPTLKPILAPKTQNRPKRNTTPSHSSSDSSSDSNEGAAAPPASEDKRFSPAASDDTAKAGGRETAKLVGLWVTKFERRTGERFAQSGRGRLAGTIKNLLASFSPDVLAAAIPRWFVVNRASFGIGLFKACLEDGDADLTGRASGRAVPGRVESPPGKYSNVGRIVGEQDEPR